MIKLKSKLKKLKNKAKQKCYHIILILCKFVVDKLVAM